MMGELMKTLTFIISVLVVLTVGQALARELSPMMVEIEAAMEATRLEVADLKLQYEAAVSDEQAMEIMRHARLAGNEELVTQLEEVIARMTAPPVKGTPIHRPVPQH